MLNLGSRRRHKRPETEKRKEKRDLINKDHEREKIGKRLSQVKGSVES